MKTLPFTTTFNPSNPNIYSTIKSLVNCLKNDNVCSFHNIKLIQSKHQSPNPKEHLTKAQYGQVLSSTFNCSDRRCECCNCILINDHYTFRNIQITFIWKSGFTCDSLSSKISKLMLLTCSLMKPFSDLFTNHFHKFLNIFLKHVKIWCQIMA